MTSTDAVGPTIRRSDIEPVLGAAEDAMHSLMAQLFNAERLDEWIAGIAEQAFTRGVAHGWQEHMRATEPSA